MRGKCQLYFEDVNYFTWAVVLEMLVFKFTWLMNSLCLFLQPKLSFSARKHLFKALKMSCMQLKNTPKRGRMMSKQV